MNTKEEKEFEELGYKFRKEDLNKLLDWETEFMVDENTGKGLISVSGCPGVGKSYLLNIFRKELLENGGELFVAMVDISDCSDEIQVYYKIAQQLDKYLKTTDRKVQQDKISNFLTLYNWLYGSGRRYFEEDDTKSIMASNKIMEKVKEAINKLKESDEEKETGEAKQGTVIDVLKKRDEVLISFLAGISHIGPYVRIAKTLMNLFSDIKEEQEILQLAKETVEAFRSRNEKERILIKLLIEGMEGTGRSVIILDNFQLNIKGEIGRDHTWLSKQNGLMAQIDALWVIGSRMDSKKLFVTLFGWCKDIDIKGFTYETAVCYLKARCESIEAEVIAQILKSCVAAVKKEIEWQQDLLASQLEQASFLPYLLNLAANYYNKLKQDQEVVITQELFKMLRSQEEFIGYYFYRNLSDLMVNAFQILSCLPTWNGQWIELVRERFDNHLLHATNLLMNSAPMERLGDESFKLHEAIKDGLYNVSNNYIKYDVQKYIYLKFIEEYGDEKSGEKDFPKKCQEIDNIIIFMMCSFEYMKLHKEIEPKVNLEDLIAPIQKCMDNIYLYNKNRGDVSDNFIRVFSFYVDKQREIYNIPFPEIFAIIESDCKEELVGELINKHFKNNNIEKFERIQKFMESCFKLADLYTYNNQPELAIRLEKLYCTFWEQMSDLYKKLEQTNSYFSCQEQLAKAQNALAYDLSYSHDYEKASEYGKRGLATVSNITFEILGNLIDKKSSLSDNLKSTLELIVNSNDGEGKITGLMEVEESFFNNLISAYQFVYQKKEDDTGKILYALLYNDHQNLRGNFQWYIYSNGSKGNYLNDVSMSSYGMFTYFQRRAIVQALLKEKADLKEVKQRTKKMINSYHNVGVYLSKEGDYQSACLVDWEANQLYLLQRKRVDFENQGNFQRLRRESLKGNGLMPVLFQTECNQSEDIFTTDMNESEPLQYIGDYYLALHRYGMAYNILSKVLVNRYVMLGQWDSKFLDTFIRFQISCYGSGKVQVFELANQFIQSNHYLSSDRTKYTNSIQIKLEQMDKIINSVKAGMKCDELVKELNKEKERKY